MERILETVGADVDVSLRSAHDEFTGGPVIDINGPDSGLLIGRRGNTLQSLQFIVQSIIRQQFDEENIRVALDVEQYRQRREDSLREMADRVANRVEQTGRSITLEPMTPSDRRVIHLFLDGQGGNPHRERGLRRQPQSANHRGQRINAPDPAASTALTLYRRPNKMHA